MQIQNPTSWVLAASRPYKTNPLTTRSNKFVFEYFFSCAKGQKKDSALRRPCGESLDFTEFLQNYTPPLGSQPKKSILRLPTGTMGWPMPNLAEIHPVVWASNPNKQTNRQAGLFCIYRLSAFQKLTMLLLYPGQVGMVRTAEPDSTVMFSASGATSSEGPQNSVVEKLNISGEKKSLQEQERDPFIDLRRLQKLYSNN